MQSKSRCLPVFSDEDADLRAMKWRLHKNGYAVGTVKQSNRPVTIFAHRVVLSRILNGNVGAAMCDHANFDRLDNRRTNLRAVTKMQNSQHQRPRGSSGYRGVSFNKQCGKWQASVKHKDKNYYCGLHDTAQEAAAAAERKRKELGFFGETEGAA